MRNEREILDLYVGSDTLRPTFNAPFLQDGYVYATDGYGLIRVKQSITVGNYQNHEKNRCDVFFLNLTEEEHIDRAMIEGLLSKVKQIDEVEYNGQTCSECDGGGEVEWEYEDWSSMFDCPKCGGSGYVCQKAQTPTGRMVADPDEIITLFGISFSVRLIGKLLKTMEMVDSLSVSVKRRKEDKFSPVVFILNDSVDVLLMPMAK